MLSVKRFSVLLLLLAIFLCHANASLISVIIQPRGQGEVITLYPYEVARYDIYIINNGSELVENLNVVIRTDEELTILIDGSEATERSFSIGELSPNGQEIESIDVKALQSGEKQFKIYVDYGFEELSYSVSTKIKIVENPILINARLDKTAINPGEEAAVVLDITNTSTAVLTDIVAELVVSEGLTSNAEEYRLPLLDPNQSFTNKEFRFSADKDITGKRDVTLKVRYSDTEGEHLIENIFSVEIQNRTAYLFMIVAGIVVLIVVSYILRQKKEQPKIDTSGIKIEGRKGSVVTEGE